MAAQRLVALGAYLFQLAGATIGDDVANNLQETADAMQQAIDSVDWSELQDACGPFQADAKAAALHALGMASDAAVTSARELCRPMAQQDCEDHVACTYCAQNSTCWPLVDLQNPCHALVVQALTFGAKTGSDAAMKLVEAGQWAASRCGQHETSDACLGGVGIFCDWCEETSSCHTKGSIMNQCLRKELIAVTVDAAAEAADTLVDEAEAQARAKWADLKSACANLDGNESTCGQQATCLWCGEAAGITHNKCYFVGDVRDNACLIDQMKPFIDSGGKIKSMAEMVGDKVGEGWTNLKQWGNNLCGKHASNKESCNEDVKCFWCDDDSECYVYGSYQSPCGVAQKSLGVVTQTWNDFWGKDPNCDSDKVEARKVLEQGLAFAKANLQKACIAYVDSEVHASRSLAALQKDLGAAKKAAGEAASMQVAKVKQAIVDTAESIKESGLQAKAMDAFDASSPCEMEQDASFAMSSTPTVLALAFIVVSYF